MPDALAALLTLGVAALALAVAALSVRLSRLARDVDALYGRAPRRGGGLRSLLVWLAAGGAAGASELQAAALAAYHDALTLPREFRAFHRYVWWPRGWPHARLLTRTQQALTSDQGALPNPVKVGPAWMDLYRLNLIESGQDRRLQVWEKLAAVDLFFHNKWKFLVDAEVVVHYPPGEYDGKKYGPTKEVRPVKKGDVVDLPAQWANPVVPSKDPGPPRRAQDELRRLLSTEAPLVAGHWLLVQTARQTSIRNTDDGVGYYEWFGVKNRDDYFKLVGLDEKTAVKIFAEWRAVLTTSGISEQNRQLVLLRGASGLVWGTLDVKKQAGAGIAVRALRRGEFDHDAEEWVAHLPSGLPVNALIAAKANDALKVKAGDAQATAPDFIGGNRAALNPTNDLRIHLDSCWDCHGTSRNYVFPFDDWARRTHVKGKAELREPNFFIQRELRSTLLRDIQTLVEDDRKHYARAVAELTSTGPKDPGLTVAGFTRIYRSEGVYRYIKPPGGITLEMAAHELGVPRDHFLKELIAWNDERAGRGVSDAVLGAFLERPPGTVTRLDFEDSYAIAQTIAHGLRVPEIVTKVKALP